MFLMTTKEIKVILLILNFTHPARRRAKFRLGLCQAGRESIACSLSYHTLFPLTYLCPGVSLMHFSGCLPLYPFQKLPSLYFISARVRLHQLLAFFPNRMEHLLIFELTDMPLLSITKWNAISILDWKGQYKPSRQSIYSSNL